MFNVRRNDRSGKRLRARLRQATLKFKADQDLLNLVESSIPQQQQQQQQRSMLSLTAASFTIPSTVSSSSLNRLSPLTPMLANVLDLKRIENYCQNEEYLCEEKFDGERLLTIVPLNTTVTVRAQFYSRALKRQANSVFPHEIRLQPEQRHDCMLDGELVYVDPKTERPIAVCDTGRRACLRVEYRVFDILYVDGHPVYCKPLAERKRLLNESLVETEHVKIVPYRTVDSVERLWAMFDEVVNDRNGGEGLMLKRKNEEYRPGERAWTKMKSLHIVGRREEFDLWLHRLLPDKNGIANVLECGYYDENGEFRLICRTSSGIDSTTRHQLRMLTNEQGYFERPTMATIVADKITEQRRSLRHPIFHRLRLDLLRDNDDDNNTNAIDSRLIRLNKND